MYNYYFNISAIFVYSFTIPCIFMRKGIKKSQNKMFLAIIIGALLASVFDVVSAIANDHPETYSVGVRDTFNYLFLIIHNATPFMFFSYIWILSGQDLTKNNKRFYFYCIPYAAVFLILLLNIPFRWCFYYDVNGVYTHGSMMASVYVIAYFYVIFSLAMVIVHWKNLEMRKK